MDVSDTIDLLPADLRGEGFLNTAVTQVPLLEHIEGFGQLASVIVGRIDLPAFVAAHGSCSDFEAACVDSYLHSAGQLLYRRPLDANDLTPLQALFEQAQSLGLSFEGAAGAALEAMLQSARFLYRIESQAGSGVRALDGYEVANRLSYLIWGAPPDSTLKAAAEAGRLSDADGIATEVERMLVDPRARETSLRYVDDWLGLHRLAGSSLGDDMRAETFALFSEITWEQNESLMRLFDAQYTFASRQLAEHYGLSDVADGVQRYDLNNDPTRIGLLTQGSILTSGGPRASYVQRGLFLLENLLCGEVGQPPPGVNDTPPTPEPGRSARYYAEERVNNGVCGRCHAQFEPVAFALGAYGGEGEYLTEDEFGNPLRTDGVFRTTYDDEGVPYSDLATFADLVASDGRVRDCLVLKFSQFAMARAVNRSDGCTLSAVQAALLDHDASYPELIWLITTQPAFRAIRSE